MRTYSRRRVKITAMIVVTIIGAVTTCACDTSLTASIEDELLIPYAGAGYSTDALDVNDSSDKKRVQEARQEPYSREYGCLCRYVCAC
jgi:hypothetical protein